MSALVAISKKLFLLSWLVEPTGAIRRKTNRHQAPLPGWSSYPPNWPFLRHCVAPTSPGGLLTYELPTCQGGQTSDFDTSAKIAVVGGGPAGVSIAKLLNDRGFNNIKLFEASDHIGGKSKRWESPSGEAHEQGTCFMTGKYECIQEWARLVGLTEAVMADDKRFVASNKTVIAPLTTPPIVSSRLYAADYAFQHLGIPPPELQAAIAEAVQRYPKAWLATMGDAEYMFPSEDKVNMSALNMTYQEWLQEHNLTTLLPILLPTMNGQGYGDPKDMPALYGLMWNHPNFIVGGPFGSGTIRMLREGFQTLWERLIQSTSADVSLESPVTQIIRKRDYVEVTYTGKDGASHKERFDWLVMAAPMPQNLPVIKDRTVRERWLFGSYQFHELVLTQYNISGGTSRLPEDFEILAWSDRLPDQTDYYEMSWKFGRLHRRMYDADGDDGPTAIRHTANVKGFKDPVVGVLQVSDFNTPDAMLTEVAKDDAREYGFDLEFLARDRWDYMPHFSLRDVTGNRKPWRIWNTQGERRTWWVGSHTSFESVADVLDYNLKLVNARLCSK